nr:hypothetical protein [Chromobacterium sp. Beijing]
MNRQALIIHAHPDPASLTAQFAALARQSSASGWRRIVDHAVSAMVVRPARLA